LGEIGGLGEALGVEEEGGEASHRHEACWSAQAFGLRVLAIQTIGVAEVQESAASS
jgi:hypothetical protein